jgi:hypothetical protein
MVERDRFYCCGVRLYKITKVKHNKEESEWICLYLVNRDFSWRMEMFRVITFFYTVIQDFTDYDVNNPL